jgi:hypothetical protein
VRLYDCAEGLPLAQLGGPASPLLVAVSPDLTVALAGPDQLSVHRLATHMSLL